MSDEIRKKKKSNRLCACPLCPCQLSVCRKLSLRYRCSVFLPSGFAESLRGLANCRHTRSIWLPLRWGRVAGAAFSSQIRKIHQTECPWLDHFMTLTKLYSHGPLSCSGWTEGHSILQAGLAGERVLGGGQPAQEPPAAAGDTWGHAASGVRAGWKHWAPQKGNGKCRLSLRPSSQLRSTRTLQEEQHLLRALWSSRPGAPESQARCTETDWIHLSLFCFPVGNSWFLTRTHFL